MISTLEKIKIGSFIQTLRKERNLSRAELASNIGLSEAQIRHLEREEVPITVSQVLLLSEYFFVSVEEIYNGKRKEMVAELTPMSKAFSLGALALDELICSGYDIWNKEANQKSIRDYILDCYDRGIIAYLLEKKYIINKQGYLVLSVSQFVDYELSNHLIELLLINKEYVLLDDYLFLDDYFNKQLLTAHEKIYLADMRFFLSPHETEVLNIPRCFLRTDTSGKILLPQYYELVFEYLALKNPKCLLEQHAFSYYRNRNDIMNFDVAKMDHFVIEYAMKKCNTWSYFFKLYRNIAKTEENICLALKIENCLGKLLAWQHLTPPGEINESEVDLFAIVLDILDIYANKAGENVSLINLDSLSTREKRVGNSCNSIQSDLTEGLLMVLRDFVVSVAENSPRCSIVFNDKEYFIDRRTKDISINGFKFNCTLLTGGRWYYRKWLFDIDISAMLRDKDYDKMKRVLPALHAREKNEIMQRVTNVAEKVDFRMVRLLLDGGAYFENDKKEKNVFLTELTQLILKDKVINENE